MAKKINVGLIGAGFMGKAHSNAYLNVAKFFSLPAEPVMKAVCCRTEKTAKALARNWGWESVETDYRKLICRKDIDLVDIATPNASHRAIAVAAAKAGKAIVCEKPLAANLRDAVKMTEAAKKARVPTFVWFNYRRVPAVALAKQLVAEGRVGEIYHVRAQYLQDWIMDPNFPLVWRLRKSVAGSGAQGDLNAHIVDMAGFITGLKFEAVSGLTRTFIKKRPVGEMSGSGLTAGKGAGRKGVVDVDDATLFLATFKGGAVGTFEGTRFAAGRRNANHIEINGSKGTLVFDFERMNELQYYDATDKGHVQGFKKILVTDPPHPYISAWWPGGHLIGYEHAFVNQLADMMKVLGGRRKKFHPDFADGLEVQRVLEAVMISAKKKQWVKIKDVK